MIKRALPTVCVVFTVGAAVVGVAVASAQAQAQAKPKASASTKAPKAPKAPKATTGAVTGVIRFDGEAPVMPVVDKSRDPNCPQDGERANWLVVGEGGGVRDVVVRLPSGAAAVAAKPERPAFVDQRGCIYRPLVQVIVAGAKVNVRNSDPTNHNVRGVRGDDTLWNEMHLKNGPDKLLEIEAPPGEAVAVHCDMHPWMETWMFVTDHAAVALTGDDGSFTLENLPAGEVTLEIWHPHLGKRAAKKTVKVKVVAGKTTTAKIPAFGPADVSPP